MNSNNSRNSKCIPQIYRLIRLMSRDKLLYSIVKYVTVSKCCNNIHKQNFQQFISTTCTVMIFVWLIPRLQNSVLPIMKKQSMNTHFHIYNIFLLQKQSGPSPGNSGLIFNHISNIYILLFHPFNSFNISLFSTRIPRIIFVDSLQNTLQTDNKVLKTCFLGYLSFQTY